MVNVNDVYTGTGNLLSAKKCSEDGLFNTKMTIKDAKLEEIGQEQKEKKIILEFEEMDDRLALNKTNAKIIAESYGNDTDNWISKKIQLVKVKRQFQGNLVDAIQTVTVDGGESPPSDSSSNNDTLTGKQITALKKKNDFVYDAIDTLSAGNFDITIPNIRKELTKMRKGEEITADEFKEARAVLTA